MKKIFLINASPRLKGTSFVLLQMCQGFLEGKGHQIKMVYLYQSLNNMDILFKAVEDADILVFSGPCYVNTYPADTIAFLEKLSAYKELLQGKSLYGMIQGGMPYVHTHESGLRVLEIFCKKCNMFYKGGFVMGLGAMLDGQPVTKLPNSKTVIRQLNIFFECISRDEESSRQIYDKAQLKLPGFIYRIMAKKMNQAIDKDLKNRGLISKH
jgi:hypothetical protein